VAFEIKRHDQRPFFVVALTDETSLVDLSTATNAYFNMGTAVGSTIGAAVITRGTAAITNATGGEVTYRWGTTDTGSSGKYLGEVVIIWSDGKQETFPGGPASGSYWPITITDDIDNA
jgi:hypothetical protein